MHSTQRTLKVLVVCVEAMFRSFEQPPKQLPNVDVFQR